MSKVHDLQTAVLSHDKDAIKDALKNVEINRKFNDGNVLLWAITGERHNQSDPVGKGDYDTVKFLLDNGANANLEYIIYSPIYYAVKECRDDIISLLVNYGSDPNTYSLRVKKDDTGKDYCICKTELVTAIENKYYLCVEALVHRGAVFNDETLKYALDIREGLYNKRKESPQNYLDYENADKIYITLRDIYDSKFEMLANNFMKENEITGQKENYFVIPTK